MRDQQPNELNRRSVLKSIAGASLATTLFPRWAAADRATGGAVRDRLWLWSHVAGSYNGMFGLPGTSRITPAAAARQMDIPNVFMIHRDGLPKPPLLKYAQSFESVREVVWGIVGAGGQTHAAERDAVLKLAFEYPKISGVVMDDFFKSGANSPKGPVAALSLSKLQSLKQRLTGEDKTLDLHVVIYEHQLKDVVSPYLRSCDVVQFWTWRGEHLGDLEPNLAKVEKLVPHARRMLGLYWWDFGNRKPMSLAAMQRQCELGLQWVREGRIAGIIFCGSWLCDRDLKTVEWTRKWIDRVGDQVCKSDGTNQRAARRG